MSDELDKPTDFPQVKVVTGWKRVVLLFLATIFFVLGALGALLPGLPTTPFLLLTSYFLVRTSPGLNAALLRSRFFGPILTDWQIHGGVRKDIKFKAIVFVVIAVAASIWFSGASFWSAVIIVLLAMIGIVVIVRLPRVRADAKH